MNIKFKKFLQDALFEKMLLEHIKEEDGKWVVWNKDYTKKLGEYPTKDKALKRLKQIEYFKQHG